MANFLANLLREEYRYHTTYTHRYAFFFLPWLIFFVSLGLGLHATLILARISLHQMLMSYHLGLFIYGIVSGALAFLGKEVADRRFGSLKFILQIIDPLPIKYRQAWVSLYLREIIFYSLLVLLPLSSGLILSTCLTHINFFSALLLSIAGLTSFLLGISFSFFLASLYRRGLVLFSIGLVALPILLCLPMLVQIESETVVFQLPLILLFFTTSYFMASRSATRRTKVSTNKYSKLEPKCGSLVARELLDLGRGNGVIKIVFSFLLPLVFLTFFIWFIQQHVELEYNAISYSCFIGFFSVVIYSWLNNIDTLDFLEQLPVGVSQVIKAKVKTHLIASTLILPVIAFGISILAHQLPLFPLAVLVAYSTSFYIVTVVAWLTGLRINYYLFDPKLLFQFGIFALLPLIPLTILSVASTTFTITTALGLSILLFLIGLALYQDLDRKWHGESFVV